MNDEGQQDPLNSHYKISTVLERHVHIRVPSAPAGLYNIKPLDWTQKCYFLLLCTINWQTMDKFVRKMKKIFQGNREECRYQQPLLICIQENRFLFMKSLKSFLMPFPWLKLSSSPQFLSGMSVVSYQCVPAPAFSVSFIDFQGDSSFIQPLSFVVKYVGMERWQHVASNSERDHTCFYRRVKTVFFILSFLRRSQKRCVSTTTYSLIWRATHQSTTCAVRSSPSTTPPKNSGESWSKLEGWGCLTQWLSATLTGLMAKWVTAVNSRYYGQQ